MSETPGISLTLISIASVLAASISIVAVVIQLVWIKKYRKYKISEIIKVRDEAIKIAILESLYSDSRGNPKYDEMVSRLAQQIEKSFSEGDKLFSSHLAVALGEDEANRVLGSVKKDPTLP